MKLTKRLGDRIPEHYQACGSLENIQKFLVRTKNQKSADILRERRVGADQCFLHDIVQCRDCILTVSVEK